MKTLTTVTVLTCLLFTAVSAHALTIVNKCSYPVAGSVYHAENNVCIAQFHLIPGEKTHLLKDFGRTRLTIRTIPDVHDHEKLTITSKDVMHPNTYIELKHSEDGVEIAVD